MPYGLVDAKGADLIVAVGTHLTLEEFLDKNRAGMASTLLTRLRVGSKTDPTSFPDSGSYVVPGALAPVMIDRQHDRGELVEPNVWVQHR
ncbi:hypothetical protein BKM31_13375 [[Actinomadura] parvosata subsp. kistnae]|uniref:Uncharacterized protein n=1 Tax=[Actinomadura] parvosata subsp. kistnae TaxID=1909395 RepID=A0A1U9ZWL2_9ACTN|nr:hypothetical protein BKM31_13375 [Nonomuraea sp. ATCC 55076]